jgi:predicted NBD/HSP70 family sugar kinase
MSDLDPEKLQHLSPRAAIDQIHRAWHDGDSFARALMDEVLDHFATGAAMVVNLFDPRVVVCGGYVLKEHPAWVEEIQRRSQGRILHASRRHTRFAVSQTTVEDELCAIAARLHPMTVFDRIPIMARKTPEKTSGRTPGKPRRETRLKSE